MSQQEILDALSELGGTATRKQIADYLGKWVVNIQKQLRQLVKHGEVRRIKYGVYQLVEEDSR